MSIRRYLDKIDFNKFQLFIKSRFKAQRGQSLVELALVFPVLLIMIAGLVEIGFYFYSYMTAVELTREAARYASQRKINALDAPSSGLPDTACNDGDFHYYFDTACVILDKGFNTYLEFDEAVDDITISVLTVSNNVITNRWPNDADGVWSLASASDGWSGSENWTKDCDGNVLLSQPLFTNSDIQAKFIGGAPTDRGLIIVEIYYCYEQVLNLPILSDFINNPFRIHAYTMMPVFDAEPTPTPIP